MDLLSSTYSLSCELEEASTLEVVHRCLIDLVESFLGDYDVDVVHTFITLYIIRGCYFY